MGANRLTERIVEVTGDLGEGPGPRYRHGSGFVVGGRTVLTAAHVVVGAVAVSVRGSDKCERPAVLDAEWIADPDRCDLALVELTEVPVPFEYVPVAVVDRDTTSGAFVEGCWSVGFPAFQEIDDGQGRSVRKSAQVGGRIAPLSNLDDRLLSLEVTKAPANLPPTGTLAESPWSGMSGAPVFAEEMLVGVVAEHARRRGASDITATPVAFLSDPSRAPDNAALWWQRLGVDDPSRLLRVPAERPAASAHTVRAGRVRFGLPQVDPHFVGRSDELGALERAMRAGGQAVITQTITGQGGVGKTQLAARYVHHHAEEYDVVAWLRAEDSPVGDLVELGAALRVEAEVEDATAEDQARAVIRWLELAPARWLLVFDNVVSAAALRTWLPATGNGRVVITSRNRDVDELGAVVAVDVFDDETGARYLLSRGGRGDPDEARELSRALGGLPLALAHAGAYCRDGSSFAYYRELLRALPARELFERDPSAAYEATVASTWQLSIAAARERALGAGLILELASYLAPDAIPVALFETLLDDRADVRARKRLQDGLRALSRYSLAQVNEGAVEVHRLLQKVVRDDAEVRGEDIGMTAALRALSEAVPGDPALPTWWPQYEALLPHITAIAETNAAERYPGRVVELLNRAAIFLLHSDAGERPLRIALAARGLADRSLPLGNRERINSHNNVGSAYELAGRTTEAIEVLERALDESKRLFGSEDSETLTVQTNLAISYQSAGRIDDAIALREQVAAESEQMLGSEHPDTLNARANLASSYRSVDRIDEAIDLQERVLADSERVLGPEHPAALIARANLASSYRSVDRIDEAIDLQERVLGDSERLLGPQHRHTINARTNLARSYLSAGRTGDAIESLERVVSDSELKFGADHAETLTQRTILADSYRLAGAIEKAIEVLERVLADSDPLRPGHPDRLTVRTALAGAYWSTGRVGAAVEALERVVTDSERLLGREHPETSTIRARLEEWRGELQQHSR